MHRFYAKIIGELGTPVELPDAESEHLFRTLRARPGEMVGVFDGKGCSALAEVGRDRKLTVRERCVVPRADLALTLAVSVPKRNRLDELLKPLAGLGAQSIDFMLCERTVVQPGDNAPAKWNTMLLEGCKQSGNPRLPEAIDRGSFEETLAYHRRRNAALFFGDLERPDEAKLPDECFAADNMVLFIGPEGGFTDREHAALRQANAHGIALGPYILRLETAAIAGAAILWSRHKEAHR
ncbi:MAG: RsmE family RNA methyltransferase [Victivallaceae bacterium]|nr:RsmE family RNA methyltransferase [Victivallaceae bacterium]